MFSLSPKGSEPPRDDAAYQSKTQGYSMSPTARKDNSNDNNASSSKTSPQQQQKITPEQREEQEKRQSRLDMYANKDDRMPHYSRVIDPIETLNPVTGRSIYYGARPWRCDDRLHDYLQSVVAFRMAKAKIAWRNLMDCSYSEFGEQPTCPYETLQRQTVMYYVDRQDHGMVRDYMFEKYPFSTRDFVRVMTDDGTKMRVWRHQRELELEAKQGRVDEIIAGGVLPTRKNADGEKIGKKGKNSVL